MCSLLNDYIVEISMKETSKIPVTHTEKKLTLR